jgi:23S rRNA (guanosine2251-2'-O)-methyltransferase
MKVMIKRALILDNIRSTHNVGSIMRSADGFGVSHIYFAGITPYPTMQNDRRLPHISAKLTAAIHKTALGAESTTPFSVHPDINDAITTAKADGYLIAALEQSPNAVLLTEYQPKNDLALILGTEVTGILDETLGHSDVILEIPMTGNKESFNVAVAGAVALYALTYGT